MVSPGMAKLEFSHFCYNRLNSAATGLHNVLFIFFNLSGPSGPLVSGGT